MNFTKEDLNEILRLKVREELSSRQIAEVMGCCKSTINYFLTREHYKDFWKEFEESKPIAAGEKHSPEHKRIDMSQNRNARYVFVSAQNNTYVHEDFLKSLENYLEYNNAKLYVSTFTYNKHSFENSTKADEDLWYDPKLRKHTLMNEPVQLAKGLVFCGELNILPTAVNPLSGLHNYTALDSAIVPHAKMQLESIPTPKVLDAKILYTTGAITQRNYVQKKAGQKAGFHHVFGAVVVEVDEDGDWFVRQLIAESDTGNFYDLENYYTPEGVYGVSGCSVEAINWGDIHVAKLDEQVASTSWGYPDSMLDTLMPKYQFMHDVYDHKYRNHHSTGNPHFMFQMYSEKTESVRSEIEDTASEMLRMDRPWCQMVVVESNHDLALERWLRESDYRKDPVNALYYLELQLAKYSAISQQEKDFKIFEYAIKDANSNLAGVRFLGTDESFVVCGVECGQHGHQGNNGARGSVRAFQIQGTKFNIGHGHSAFIKDGVYAAGVSGKKEMGYNVGGSGWSHSHIITYANGKRATATLKNGKWKGDF